MNAARAICLTSSPIRSPEFEAIAVAQNSPMEPLAALKGKKIGLAKVSRAHNTTLLALEKAGLPMAVGQSIRMKTRSSLLPNAPQIIFFSNFTSVLRSPSVKGEKCSWDDFRTATVARSTT